MFHMKLQFFGRGESERGRGKENVVLWLTVISTLHILIVFLEHMCFPASFQLLFRLLYILWNIKISFFLLRSISLSARQNFSGILKMLKMKGVKKEEKEERESQFCKCLLVVLILENYFLSLSRLSLLKLSAMSLNIS